MIPTFIAVVEVEEVVVVGGEGEEGEEGDFAGVIVVDIRVGMVDINRIIETRRCWGSVEYLISNRV